MPSMSYGFKVFKISSAVLRPNGNWFERALAATAPDS
jgi:hypothetical protein